MSDVEELEPFKPKTPAAADDLSDVEELEPAPAKPASAKPSTPPAMETFAIGARIEARFNGSDAWYPGKVFAVHPDQTYYIRFDDGDEQDNVPAADVRKAEDPAAEEPAAAGVEDDILADSAAQHDFACPLHGLQTAVAICCPTLSVSRQIGACALHSFHAEHHAETLD